MQFDAVVTAPFGAVGIAVQGLQVAIELLPNGFEPKPAMHKLAKRAVEEIEAYLADPYHCVSLPLVFKGTSFQRHVWQRISAIPVGQTITYSMIAEELGSGPRAVANACGANYLPLLVPCHRVVAKKGMGGFMQGNPKGHMVKKWLLRHEGVDV